MPNKSDEDDKKIIGQMFKSMIERNPKKRKIKPNSRNYEMLNLEFFEDTSSEDEDYKLPNNAPEDDEIDDSDENVENSSNENEESDSNDDESNSDEDESSNDEDNENTLNRLNNLKNENSYSISETTSTEKKTSIKIKFNNKLTSQHSLPNSSAKELAKDQNSKFKNLLICSICLSDESLESDEIAECDCCLITVHESCYGLINPNEEVESLDSNASDNPTEPWFCDACKANKNVKDLNCELCPRQGGIFKQTETGRWVHLVCALYINGVAFSNTQQLRYICIWFC